MEKLTFEVNVGKLISSLEKLGIQLKISDDSRVLNESDSTSNNSEILSECLKVLDDGRVLDENEIIALVQNWLEHESEKGAAPYAIARWLNSHFKITDSNHAFNGEDIKKLQEENPLIFELKSAGRWLCLKG